MKTSVAQFEGRHLATLRAGAPVRRHFDRFVLPVWGECEIQSIARRDLIDLLDGIMDSGRATTAKRIKAYLSKFFSRCVDRDIPHKGNQALFWDPANWQGLCRTHHSRGKQAEERGFRKRRRIGVDGYPIE